MKLILSLFTIFLCLSASANTYGDAECELVSVIDGDTIKCNIAGYPDIIGREISVRFRGINTPEIRGEEREQGLISRQKLVNILSDKQTIMLRDISRDKYFRIDADIYADGMKVNEESLLMP